MQRSLRLCLRAGHLQKLTGWYRIPEPIRASADGLLIYDSAGGEALGIRMHHSATWKKIEVFRKVPTSGQISISLALTGLGTVYFDDLKIEAINPASTSVATTPVK